MPIAVVYVNTTAHSSRYCCTAVAVVPAKELGHRSQIKPSGRADQLALTKVQRADLSHGAGFRTAAYPQQYRFRPLRTL